MVDPISDMLTRIRNAQAVGHAVVILPFSKIKFSLAEILKKKMRKMLSLKLNNLNELASRANENMSEQKMFIRF